MMEDLWKKITFMKTTTKFQRMKKVLLIWSISICLDLMVGGDELTKEMMVHKGTHYTLQTSKISL